MIVHNNLLHSREKTKKKHKLLYKKEQIICIFKQYKKYTYTIHSSMFDEVNASYYFSLYLANRFLHY